VNVEIRTEPFDGLAAQQLIEAVQQEYVRRYGGRDQTPVDPGEFAPPRGIFLVAYADGEPAACGGWRVHGEDAEIKRMFVVEAMRGRGLARRILAELESAAVAAGLRRAILETGTAQPEALALYESSGYTLIPGFGFYACEPNSRCFAKALPVGQPAV
jgi:GNAT superfamily N-acetyltransferase